MKIVTLCLFLCLSVSLTSFADAEKVKTDDTLFDFSLQPASDVSDAPEAKAPSTDKAPEKTETPSEEPITKKVSLDDDKRVTDALLTKALISKYGVKIDTVFKNMETKLAKYSTEDRRKFLERLLARIEEKKTFIAEKKDLDPLKKDTYIILLNYLVTKTQ